MKEPIPRGRPKKRPEPERDKDTLPPDGPRKRGRPRKFH
jgi:hypothetical protein